jgi:two-component system response regulator VicR
VAKILIIDDDPVFAELTARRLGTGGHTVEVRHEDTEALTEVRRVEYDLLLIDVVMPGISGPLLMNVLGATEHGRLKMAFLSSTDVAKLATLAEEHNADGWVSKSATRVELLAKVDLFLRREHSAHPSRKPHEDPR